MGYRMDRINPGRNPLVNHEVRGRVFLRAVALVEDQLYVHSPLVRLHQCLRNRGRGEGIRLNEDRLFRVAEFRNNRRGASAVRGKENLNVCLLGTERDRQREEQKCQDCFHGVDLRERWETAAAMGYLATVAWQVRQRMRLPNLLLLNRQNATTLLSTGVPHSAQAFPVGFAGTGAGTSAGTYP